MVRPDGAPTAILPSVQHPSLAAGTASSTTLYYGLSCGHCAITADGRFTLAILQMQIEFVPGCLQPGVYEYSALHWRRHLNLFPGR